ncbi:MAG: transposase [Gammaproteobacteria bacterium]
MDTHHPDDRHTPQCARPPTKQTRRRYTLEQKREMVEATLADGQSVSVVARHYDVNANQLFRWRKQYREGLLGEADGLKLLPVEVSETPVSADADATGRSLSVAADGTLEVVLSNQHCLRISGSVCQQSLTTILQVLS